MEYTSDEERSCFYWHVHHDCLVEFCYNYNERQKHILKFKPESERELRLRLFQPVRGELPVQFVEARRDYDEAYRACAEEILALHTKECPDCPWDGETIFPK